MTLPLNRASDSSTVTTGVFRVLRSRRFMSPKLTGFSFRHKPVVGHIRPESLPSILGLTVKVEIFSDGSQMPTQSDSIESGTGRGTACRIYMCGRIPVCECIDSSHNGGQHLVLIPPIWNCPRFLERAVHKAPPPSQCAGSCFFCKRGGRPASRPAGQHSLPVLELVTVIVFPS